MAKLTKTVIDGLKPKAKDYFEWDDGLPGFGVRVWPTGKKVYLAQYRANNRTRRMKIGNHGALTVEEARKMAKTILGDVARGEDPQEDRITQRKTLTVKQLCENYLEAAEAGLILTKRDRPKKASTLYTDRGRIVQHIVPLLGKKRVVDLTQKDITRFIRNVTSGKTAIEKPSGKKRGITLVRGGAGTASRTTGLLGGILSFAVSEGVIEQNPAGGVQRQADKVKEKRLETDEFRALGNALAEFEDEGRTWQGYKGVWLLALTGCRLGEVEKLKWEEVDIAGRCLRLADSKEGSSIRPLGWPAIDVLKRIERVKGSPFVLPAVRGDEAYGGMPGAIERIMKRAGLKDVSAHTLRHSFASEANDLGYTEATIDALIGHSTRTTTGKYIHHLDDVLIAAADKVAGTIHALITDADGGKLG